MSLPHKLTRQQVISHGKKIAKANNGQLTIKQWNENPICNYVAIYAEFGSWGEFKRACGVLSPGAKKSQNKLEKGLAREQQHQQLCNDTIQAVRDLADDLGRTPGVKDWLAYEKRTMGIERIYTYFGGFNGLYREANLEGNRFQSPIQRLPRLAQKRLEKHVVASHLRSSSAILQTAHYNDIAVMVRCPVNNQQLKYDGFCVQKPQRMPDVYLLCDRNNRVYVVPGSVMMRKLSERSKNNKSVFQSPQGIQLAFNLFAEYKVNMNAIRHSIEIACRQSRDDIAANKAAKNVRSVQKDSDLQVREIAAKLVA